EPGYEDFLRRMSHIESGEYQVGTETGRSSYVRFACAVHSDSSRAARFVASQVGRINQRRCIGLQRELRDKDARSRRAVELLRLHRIFDREAIRRCPSREVG